MADHEAIIETGMCSTKASPLIFESREPYNAERIHAAAIYCSDGRFGIHCDDFIHHHLKLPRYDRLVIPGGPGNLTGNLITYREGEALTLELRFLIDAHGLDRVVLIGHEGCAFYTQRLHIPQGEALERQREDLRTAADRIREMSAKIEVEGFLALRREDRIVFEAVNLAVARQRTIGTAWA